MVQNATLSGLAFQALEFIWVCESCGEFYLYWGELHRLGSSTRAWKPAEEKTQVTENKEEIILFLKPMKLESHLQPYALIGQDVGFLRPLHDKKSAESDWFQFRMRRKAQESR